MTLHVAFVNQSKHVPTDIAAKIAAACSRQLRLHTAPLWNRSAPGVAYVSDALHVLDGTRPFYFLDNADVADALGYHDVDPHGRPYAKIFVEPILDSGGTLTDGANSVSVTASHEANELFGDEFCNDWSQANDGYSYAKELCDPCEGDGYVMSGTGIWVSDFVLPEYFSDTPEAGARFDYMGKLTAPFTMTAGGYLIRMKDGKVDQVFADSYPEWKRAGKLHPAARTSQRARSAGGLVAA